VVHYFVTLEVLTLTRKRSIIQSQASARVVSSFWTFSRTSASWSKIWVILHWLQTI